METQETATQDFEKAYAGVVGVVCNEGDIQPGDKLPNERKLAKKLLISRSKVRSVFAKMEKEGIVRRKVGAGTFLTEQAPSLLEMHEAGVNLRRRDADGFSFHAMIEARLQYEPQVASIAAKAGDPAACKKLDKCLAAINEPCAWIEFKDRIYALHRQIYLMADNSYLLLIFDAIHKRRRQVNYDGTKLDTEVTNLVRHHAYHDLKPICDAISAGDSNQAAKQTSSYLARLLAAR